MKVNNVSRYLNPERAKKRLFYGLLVFFISIAVPVYFLLNTVYSQLENELWYQRRNQAELLVQRIEQLLLDKLQPEQDRAIAEYSFFNVLENRLLQSATVNFSPLSALPLKSDIPGLIGYFQIDPQGIFHIPALPELDSDLQSGLGAEALTTRIALKAKLRALLDIERPKSEQIVSSKRQLSKDEQPEPVTSPSVKERFDDYVERDTQTLDKPMTAQAEVENNKRVAAKARKAQRLSEEELQQLNIKTALWKQKNKRDAASSSIASKYTMNYRQQPRKEVVKIPDQSSASALFKPRQSASVSADKLVEQQASGQIARRAEPLDAESAGNITRASEQQLPVNILSFESEVSPLQMISLKNGHLCFYRNAWQGKSRYIQGFIVDAQFLHKTISSILEGAHGLPLSRLLLVNEGHIVEQFKITDSEADLMLFRRVLLAPFQSMEVIVNTATLDADASKQMLDMLSLALAVIIGAGFVLFYHLGAGQIELAKQQRNFISSVSHELKTPLTSIRMYSEMLRADWVPDEHKKQSYYDYIYFESERLSRLISNVLQLARLDNHQQKVQRVAVSPAQLLQQVQAKIAAQIEAEHYHVQFIQPEGETDRVELKVDEDAFFQIMINLVDNAIKFSRKAESKRIDIGYKIIDRGKTVLFYVRDYGPGVDQQQMKKIFRLFYRAGDELTRTQPGTGIGLALVVQLAESMHATVDVLNRSPGAEFQLSFGLSRKLVSGF